MKPPLTPLQKQQKKARDILDIRCNGLISAWSQKKLHTWSDVYRHEGYAQDDITKFENQSATLTFAELKDYIQTQKNIFETACKQATAGFNITSTITTSEVTTKIPFTRVTLGSDSDASDCTVISLSVACSLPYERARESLTLEGHKYNSGLRLDWFGEFLRSIGFEALLNIGLTLDKSLSYCTKGRFILVSKNHAFAVMDGVVHDHTEPVASTVINRIYEFKSVNLFANSKKQDDKPEEPKDDNYGYTRSEFIKANLFWFQKKAAAEVTKKIKEGKTGIQIIGGTGTGKTYTIGAILEQCIAENWQEGRTYSWMPYLLISKATIVEQTSRVMEKCFSLDEQKGLEITNIESLRATKGQLWLKRELKIVDGEEKEYWVWKNNMQPALVVLDESQGAKNKSSTQSQIICSYNDITCAEVCLICVSATPFTRVTEAKAFAVATHRPMEHLGFPPGTVLTNENWPVYAKMIAHPAAPDEYNEAAVKRLTDDLEDWIVRHKGVRPQFHAINGVKMIPFPNKESEQRYITAWERFEQDMIKLNKIRDQGGDVGSCYLVILLRYSMAAELEHAEQFARDMYHCVQEGKAAVAAPKFKQTLIRIVKTLEKMGVTRDQISLIWGGGQTMMNEKQKNKEKIKSLKDKLEAAGMSVEELIEVAGLEEVEDRVYEDLPAHLRLGNQSLSERQREIDKFQRGDSLYCIYTLKSGGVGLSLHHSDELTAHWNTRAIGYDEWKKKIDEWNSKRPVEKQVKPGKCRRKESGYVFEEDIPFIPVRERETFCVVTYNAIELVQGVGRVPRLTSLSNSVQNVYCFVGTIEVQMGRIYSQKLRCLNHVVKTHEDWQQFIFGQGNRYKLMEEILETTKDKTEDNNGLIDEAPEEGEE